VAKMKFDKTISSILIILLIVAISATVYIIINPNPGEKFTEFYILGAGDMAGNYPTNLNLNETGNLTIGIVNHEHTTTSYNVITTLNGTTITNENYTLANNETKMINYTFTPTKTGNQTLEFMLYKLPNNGTVYRSLLLYVNVV
jgi:uncharacterized membrane protein